MIHPSAIQRLLPENATQKRIAPTQFIIHTAVDAPGDTALWLYFGRTDVGVESHFYIARTGALIQMMDTNVRADANYLANDRAISVEIEDDGNPDSPMNAAQLRTLIDLARWARDAHGIPAVAAPAWDKPGFGYHTLFPQWTNVSGKTCPGSGKKTQFTADLMPALQEETDMLDSPNLNDAQFLERSYQTILLRPSDPGGLAFWAAKLAAREMTRNDVRWEFLLVRQAATDAAVAALGRTQALAVSTGVVLTPADTDAIVRDVYDRFLEDLRRLGVGA